MRHSPKPSHNRSTTRPARAKSGSDAATVTGDQQLANDPRSGLDSRQQAIRANRQQSSVGAGQRAVGDPLVNRWSSTYMEWRVIDNSVELVFEYPSLPTRPTTWEHRSGKSRQFEMANLRGAARR